ncbi:hypothetical protein JET18_15855 [Chryseobacterium sp. L7]|uniref:Uncharacterized protein n=1 Tax=Chryseobacterium endalhagicum TaxID=2797638 RepID=A0ABS1QJ53_9FLAO|nr:hypothetical protein [Chryseobacterium endalhagicum]MBL1222326.1 hypothetical protein [Chryseobacterium endalhagicum]
MKNLVIILGVALTTSFTTSSKSVNLNTEITAPTVKPLIDYTYYKVTRKTGVAPRNAAEADELAGMPATAYLGTSACRSWWLNKPVVAGPGAVTWSYYYSANGTVTTSSMYFLIACPF